MMDKRTRRDTPDNAGENVLIAVPPIEAWVDREKKEYRLAVALPGVDRNDLQLNVQGNSLTVSGEPQGAQQDRNAYYLNQEFSRRRLHRTIALPEGIDTQRLTAEYNNGILEIKAPLRESGLPRKIDIAGAGTAKGASAS
jgi:HSP20 family protein